MADQSQVTAVAAGLLRLGASRGAAQVLLNAVLQRQAAEERDLAQWTPSGLIPIRDRPGKHLNPANDEHASTPDQPASPLA